MTFLLKTISILAFLNASFLAKSQTINALRVNYAYENVIFDDDNFMNKNLANIQFGFYIDSIYTMVNKSSKDSSQKSFDAIKMWAIKEKASGKSYTCMEIGKKKMKIEGENLIDIIFTTALNDTLFNMIEGDGKPIMIVDIPCNQLNLMQIEDDQFYNIYVTNQYSPSEAIADFNMFVGKGVQYNGLCLGIDEYVGDVIYKRRVQSIIVNKSEDIAAFMKTFKEANREEINAAIKELIGF
jgi:hypothetical protein